jgi:hypothetical protein
LFIVADAENVAMLFGKSAEDPVLHRAQILEFINQEVVPPGTQLGGSRGIGPE